MSKKVKVEDLGDDKKLTDKEKKALMGGKKRVFDANLTGDVGSVSGVRAGVRGIRVGARTGVRANLAGGKIRK